MSKIRRIPGAKGTIMDRAQFPANHLFYNPSVDQSGEFVYLRDTEVKESYEYNHLIIYHTPTQELRKIVIPEGFLLPTYNAYRGIEDVRLIKHNDRLWFTATSTHASRDMRNTVLLGYLDKENKKVEYITVLTNFIPPTKNISPFVYDNELYLLDAYGMQVFEVSKSGDEFVATKWKSITCASGISMDKYRGSTSPVHLHGNTWGYVVHDVIFNDSSAMPGSKLSYYHYWVEIDVSRGVVTFLSDPFWCMHWGIEFVSGIRYDKGKDEVYMYFGVKDESPCMCTTKLHDLRVGK